MKRLFDKYAPMVLCAILVVATYALSIAMAVWSVKLVLKLMGVI